MDELLLKQIKIKENSWIAKLAAKKLGVLCVAIVFGRTIHLHNATCHDLLKNEKWLKHELCHVRQYNKYGFLVFIAKYLWESLRKGYYNNRFEVEARESENL
jgi:hypothetical protein